jgi:class 3 adenylate cyclase
MAHDAAQRRLGVTFGLRIKITLTFFVISALVSALLSVSSYEILRRALFANLQGRVANLTRIGSELIDTAALKRLAGKMSATLSPEQAAAIERSRDYRTVSEELNRIRDTESKLVRFVYLFVPTDNVNTALYAVDADVLALLAKKAAGEKIDDADISHFGSEFDMSAFPVARQVIRERKASVEQSYSYDGTFKVNSLSGYAPVFDGSGKTMLAVLGLDMVDADVRAVLQSTTRLSILIIAAAMILALGSAVFLGVLFTRSIISLDRVVRRFGESNLDVRAVVKTRDEVGRLGTSFNQMAETIQRYSAQLEALLVAYGRFVPQDFLRFLDKASVLDVKLGDQVQKEMTILFSDIRSFTALSESMTPAENFNFLNSFLSRVGPEIRSHNGFIDKYIGDAIMALFPASADDAVDAALAMLFKLKEYNGHRRSSGYSPISIGVGIHTGNLMLGTLGEHERMDGSVIADAVNLCSRLQGLTRLYGGSILVTGHTLGLLKPGSDHCTRFLDRVRVKGRKDTVMIHEIYDADPPAVREKKRAITPAFLAALQAYYGRDIAAAEKQFRELKRRSPNDKILDIYIVRCARLRTGGVPEGWTGVESITMK